jgi:hypothetical protein
LDDFREKFDQLARRLQRIRDRFEVIGHQTKDVAGQRPFFAQP